MGGQRKTITNRVSAAWFKAHNGFQEERRTCLGDPKTNVNLPKETMT